jgi:hypothetical protein
VRTIKRQQFRVSFAVCLAAIWIIGSAQAADEPNLEADVAAAMRKVHAGFKGERGSFAQFGDSITVTQAYWAPLAYEPQGLDQAAAADLALVKKYMRPACWRWKGPEYGSEGGQTIVWAREHVDDWLKALQPETVLIMFGTNDLTRVSPDDYARTYAQVVDKCLAGGSVVIVSTIPPRHGMLEKSQAFAKVVRQLAAERKLPLVDYQQAVLERRPDDWDGALRQFKDSPGDEYQVPTLIARDGVHPSNPSHYPGFSAEALSHHGYALRSWLSLRAYATVIRDVLEPAAGEN